MVLATQIRPTKLRSNQNVFPILLLLPLTALSPSAAMSQCALTAVI